MIWYWYVATPYELFIDMDRYSQSIAHVRMRLQSAIEGKYLDIISVYDQESSPGKHHVVITLAKPMVNYERYVWEMILHSDIYRAACNIMRATHGIPAEDILISKTPLHRLADMTCSCEKKHKRSVMEDCWAAGSLRGKHRSAVFFGKPTKTKCNLL